MSGQKMCFCSLSCWLWVNLVSFYDRWVYFRRRQTVVLFLRIRSARNWSVSFCKKSRLCNGKNPSNRILWIYVKDEPVKIYDFIRWTHLIIDCRLVSELTTLTANTANTTHTDISIILILANHHDLWRIKQPTTCSLKTSTLFSSGLKLVSVDMIFVRSTPSLSV